MIIIPEEYIIGSGIPPDWLKNKLIPYRKMEGTVGYEFQGTFRIFCLSAGDKLVRNGRRIDVKQRKGKQK